MAANMVKNLVAALKRWPITSVNMWLDSMEALYYICNPRKAWKAFVSNWVRKIAEITQETGIVWRHCPTDKNLSDLGSHSASIDKTQKGQWFEGPELLLNKEEWPKHPKLERMQSVSERAETRKIKGAVLWRKGTWSVGSTSRHKYTLENFPLDCMDSAIHSQLTLQEM